MLELVIELRCQRLVVRQNQRRTVQLLNDLRDREGLPRAGHPKQHLVLLAALNSGDKLLDRAPLIPARLVIAD